MWSTMLKANETWPSRSRECNQPHDVTAPPLLLGVMLPRDAHTLLLSLSLCHSLSLTPSCSLSLCSFIEQYSFVDLILTIVCIQRSKVELQSEFETRLAQLKFCLQPILC